MQLQFLVTSDFDRKWIRTPAVKHPRSQRGEKLIKIGACEVNALFLRVIILRTLRLGSLQMNAFKLDVYGHELVYAENDEVDEIERLDLLFHNGWWVWSITKIRSNHGSIPILITRPQAQFQKKKIPAMAQSRRLLKAAPDGKAWWLARMKRNEDERKVELSSVRGH